VNMNLWQTVLP